jgi:Tol biopolymer transport system component
MGLAAGAVVLGGRRVRAAVDDVSKGRLYFMGRLKESGDELFSIYAVDLATGQWDRVADRGRWARVSPDGKTIAFMRFQPRSQDPDGVWVGDARGAEEPRRVVDFNGMPCWSPDGKALIVSGLESEEGDEEVRFQNWRMKPDGSDKVRLPIPIDEQVMDWSRDGRRLLSLRRNAQPAKRTRQSFSPFLRKADGTGPRPLTEATDYATHRFAPDSRRVSFARQEGEAKEPGDYAYSLWVADADGGEPRRMIRGDSERSAFFACWSPDGKRLAVDVLEPRRDDDGKYAGLTRHIELMDADGGHARRVELPHLNPIPLDWAQDE